MPERSKSWLLPASAVLWSVVVWYLWSPRHYWPDADGYLLHVAEGRWVAHPPGYALFVMLGRLFHAAGYAPYVSMQMASLSATVAGLGVLYLLMRRLLDPLRAQALTIAAAFSWVVFLNVQTGTSHASDLFTVSLVLLAAVRLPSSAGNAWRRDLFFAAALFLCAGFRLTTLLMLSPLFFLVAWRNRSRSSFRVSCLLGLLAIGLWQSWVIRESGGYAIYSLGAANMNADNRPSSVLLSGFTQTTALNMIRALLWAGVGTLPLLVVALGCWRGPVPPAPRYAFFCGLAACLGPLLGVMLYLCTHPGYVVSVIPGAALIAASLASVHRTNFPWRASAVSAVCLVGMFLLMAPFVPPTTKWQAIANGILLQYSAGCARTATFNTTARWLKLAGLDSEIPSHRVVDLQQEDKWREYFDQVDPSRHESANKNAGEAGVLEE